MVMKKDNTKKEKQKKRLPLTPQEDLEDQLIKMQQAKRIRKVVLKVCRQYKVFQIVARLKILKIHIKHSFINKLYPFQLAILKCKFSLYRVLFKFIKL